MAVDALGAGVSKLTAATPVLAAELLARRLKAVNANSWRILVTAYVVLVGSVASATSLYTVTDLGASFGSDSFASGINESGQVTGGYQGFLYSNGTMTDLGGLAPGEGSIGYAINDAGQVTGLAWLQSNTAANPYHAFIYSNGKMTDVGSLGWSSAGIAINNSGQIAGNSNYEIAGANHPFLYTNGTMIDLAPDTIFGNASGINNAGQVTGVAWNGSNYHAFIWSNGEMFFLPDPGYSSGGAINDAGQVTGCAGPSIRECHAFLYSNGVMTDLGTLGGNSSGSALNSDGLVVGGFGAGYPTHAFLYMNGTMTDLNALIDPSLGIVLANASGINDLGQIAATGATSAGSFHAYLLTPVSTAVPEPSTLGTIAGGLFGLMVIGCVVRRK